MLPISTPKKSSTRDAPRRSRYMTLEMERRR